MTLIGIVWPQKSRPSACLRGPWPIRGTSRRGDQSSWTSSWRDQSLSSPSPWGLRSFGYDVTGTCCTITCPRSRGDDQGVLKQSLQYWVSRYDVAWDRQAYLFNQSAECGGSPLVVRYASTHSEISWGVSRSWAFGFLKKLYASRAVIANSFRQLLKQDKIYMMTD